jgi:hypothetical protein
MKIPRKKEKPEQPVIVSRITILSSRGIESRDEEQCMEDL